MPDIHGRLTCCTCGADLGSADDPYRDPDCMACLRVSWELDRAQEPSDDEIEQALATTPWHPNDLPF